MLFLNPKISLGYPISTPEAGDLTCSSLSNMIPSHPKRRTPLRILAPSPSPFNPAVFPPRPHGQRAAKPPHNADEAGNSQPWERGLASALIGKLRDSEVQAWRLRLPHTHTHSLTHSLTHTLTHSLTHSHTHSLSLSLSLSRTHTHRRFLWCALGITLSPNYSQVLTGLPGGGARSC